MLKVECGYETDWAYWVTNLALNRAVMEAIEEDDLPYDPSLVRRPLPATLRRVYRDEPCDDGENRTPLPIAFQA